MKIKFLLIAFFTTVFLSSCNSSGDAKPAEDLTTSVEAVVSSTIPYSLAQNYFVKNTFTGSLSDPKIESDSLFNSIFGMATTMGTSGKPTPIDFSKQFVIAVIPAKSDTLTMVSAKELSQTGNVLTLKYGIAKGAKQGFVSQPLLLVIVDKTYDGAVKTEKIID